MMESCRTRALALSRSTRSGFKIVKSQQVYKSFAARDRTKASQQWPATQSVPREVMTLLQ